MTRRLVIGVVGGDRQADAARSLGRSIADAGCILLTGGRPNASGEAKDEAMLGAKSSETPRLVGVLPSETVQWEQPSKRELYLSTGVPHNIRNVINGMTPDVLLVLGGSRGTLAEAAFALSAGKNVVFADFFLPVSTRLKKNYKKYFDTEGNVARDVWTYLAQPVGSFPQAWERIPTPRDLCDTLERALASDPQKHPMPSELVDTCIASGGGLFQQGPTGFPGLPNSPATKRMFEQIVGQISV